MKQALVGQGTDREQGNSHLEWASQPPPFLVVPENKLIDPLHFKTLMPIMTRGKTKYGEFYACVCVQRLSCVSLFATLWIVARQAPLSTELSRQEYWSGLSFPPPGALPDPGIKSVSPACISCSGRWILCHLSHLASKGYKSDNLEFGPEHLMIWLK